MTTMPSGRSRAILTHMIVLPAQSVSIASKEKVARLAAQRTFPRAAIFQVSIISPRRAT
jgi:hypothetical protein